MKPTESLLYKMKRAISNYKNFIIDSGKIICKPCGKTNVDEQMKILEEAQENLTDHALEKLTSSIGKNKDLYPFTSKDHLLSFLFNIKYAPLTSVEVEWSFSALKNLLTEKRTNLSDENLEQLLVIQCNNCL